MDSPLRSRTIQRRLRLPHASLDLITTLQSEALQREVICEMWRQTLQQLRTAMIAPVFRHARPLSPAASMTAAPSSGGQEWRSPRWRVRRGGSPASAPRSSTPPPNASALTAQEQVESIAMSPGRRFASHATAQRLRSDFLRELDNAAWLATNEILKSKEEQLAAQKSRLEAIAHVRIVRRRMEQRRRLRQVEHAKDFAATQERDAFRRREAKFIEELRQHVELREKFMKESRVVAVKNTAQEITGASQYIPELMKTGKRRLSQSGRGLSDVPQERPPALGAASA